ncbi:MAG: hypothetical protein PVH17_12455, partial [Anaerolineae bacterium]
MRPGFVPRLAGLCMAAMVLALVGAGAWSGSTHARPSSLLERQRYGYVTTSGTWRQDFDLAQVGAGWYIEGASPGCHTSPGGMDRTLVVRVHAGYTVDPEWLGPIIDKHPGTLWAIGNEPDCIWQDNLWPEEYAHIYHDLYYFIKGRDPTSQVSPGGIVQPTPLRFEWLDRVLAEYQTVYSEAMPVDVWNIHNMLLPEKKGSWGADIPPGIDATEGVSRTIQDNDNMDLFEEQIWTFRQWMADRGYGGHPLLITEYGILMPAMYGFDAERVGDFMSATFEFFENTTDPDLGDPTDNYRLVQRWAWFSLDYPPYDPDTNSGFNGNLFNSETKAITAHGLNYASHTDPLPALNYVELSPGAFHALPASDVASSTQTISRSLQVEILNEGTEASGIFT